MLVLLVIMYVRCLQHPAVYGSGLDQHDDVRENIIHYDEEGVGGCPRVVLTDSVILLWLLIKRSDSYIALLTRWPDQRALQSRKWQLIGMRQWCCSANCGHPIARIDVQLDPRYAASKHTTAPINRTRPSPRKHSPDVAIRARKQTSDYSLLLNLSTSKGLKAESTCVAGYIPK